MMPCNLKRIELLIIVNLLVYMQYTNIIPTSVAYAASIPVSQITSLPEHEPTTEPESEPEIAPHSENELIGMTTEPESELEIAPQPENEPVGIKTEAESEPEIKPQSENNSIGITTEPNCEINPIPEELSEPIPEAENEPVEPSNPQVTSEAESPSSDNPGIEPALDPESGLTAEPESEVIVETENESNVEPELLAEPESEPEPEAEAEWDTYCANSPEPCSEGEYTNITEPIGELFTEGETVGWVIAYAITIILIIFLNIVIIVSVIKDKELISKPPNMFLLSLIIARTSVAIFVMPARITGMFSSELIGPTLCKLCHYAGSGSAVASMFSTCGVAITKLTEVKNPLAQMSVKRTSLDIIFLWVVSYLYALRDYFLNDLALINTFAGPIWACTSDPQQITANRVFIFIDLTVLFVIPLFIVWICYARVVQLLNRKLKSDMPQQQIDDQKILKGIKMLIAVMVIFTLCNLAVYAWKLYIFFNSVDVFTERFVHIEQGIYLVSYANPWMNVFIYMYFHDDIREDVFAKCKCKPRYKSHKIMVSPIEKV